MYTSEIVDSEVWTTTVRVLKKKKAKIYGARLKRKSLIWKKNEDKFLKKI